jgi:ELWxxDGT repeat protein
MGWRSRCALAGLALWLGFATPATLRGATARLLVDANPAPPPPGSTGFYRPPSQFATLSGRALFFVESAGLEVNQPAPGPGIMLWVTDGTKEGTELIAGFCTDEIAGCEGRARFLGRLGASLLFEIPRSQFDDHRDLWRTDGTREGTFLLKSETCPDRYSTGDTEAIAGGSLFFAGFDAEAGCELWHSDGTAAGTGRVSALGPAGYGSHPHEFVALGERAFFTIYPSSGTSGGLWVTDGTPGGTSLFADFPYIELLTVVGGRMFFVAPDTGFALWTSDGTIAGTRSLRHFESYELCYRPSECYAKTTFLQPEGDGVFFVADDGDGLQFWSSDGTAGGTQRLTRIASPAALGMGGGLQDHGAAVGLPGSLLLLVSPDGSRARLWASHGGLASQLVGCPRGCPVVQSFLQPVPGGRRVVFAGWSRRSKGTELWTSDGTAAGTNLVSDLCAGHCSSNPSNFMVLGDAVYFTATDEEGSALWRTDGTAAGTVFLGRASLPPFFPAPLPPGGAVLGDQVVLGVAAGSRGSDLWVTAGSAASTRSLATFDRVESSSSPQFASLGDRVVFTAFGNRDMALWSSDGVTSQRLAKASQAGCKYADGFSAPIRAGGHVFTFAGNFQDGDIFSGCLVATDGTPAGTSTIAELGDTVRARHEFGGRLVFVVETEDHRKTSFWSSDGTVVGTKAFLSLPSSGTTKLMDAGGFLYFFSSLGSDYSLFRSDGTADGTVSFGSFWSLGYDPEVAVAGGQVFFTEGSGLYRLDNATVDYDTFTGFSEVTGLTELAGRLLFFGVAGGDSPQRALWSTDGTVAGTVLLAQVSAQPLAPGGGYYALPAWPRLGGHILLRAWDAEHGFELWITDGTAAGTTRLDLAPGSASSFPDNFAVAAGRVWFTANDGVHGRELWVSDGTPTGTHQTMELAPGMFSALPLGLTAAGGNLFFSAYTPLNGREPWVLPLAGVP